MNIDELRDIFIKEKVNMANFSLIPEDIITVENGWALRKIKDKVLYYEQNRNDRENKKWFDDENTACQYLLKQCTFYNHPKVHNDLPQLVKYIEEK